ncbi:barrier-to-autointegration factor isoform X2 [Amia ocellicauda]|uniref:barrier-to-autointegration factor isoform X2 n=1 Tax=Amia ocellicauda TaxID=2972642 RepID=UPI003464C82E
MLPMPAALRVGKRTKRAEWKSDAYHTDMSTTSQKHRDFVAEPMGEKPVSALSGIGEVLGRKLEEQGFDKASVVLGQFLVLKQDDELFTEWLKDACGANTRQASSCYQCLKEWCDTFL